MHIDDTSIEPPSYSSESGESERPLSGFRKFINKPLNLLGIRAKNSLKESLEEVIEEHDSADIDGGERVMLRNVLAFSELKVEDVMIPRSDIMWVDYSIELDELKRIIAEKAHTRMPICRGTMDDVVGFIHIKDFVSILCDNKPFNINNIIRQLLFVPPSMKVSALLVKMQLSRVHMALVVDEYGGTGGLVTMEDLMEEIVGEIEDEHDISEEANLTQINPNLYEASARISIAELEEQLGIDLIEDAQNEEFDTLGGMIFAILRHVPITGEVAVHPKGLEFEIIDADPRRIKRVLIRRTQIENIEKSPEILD